MSNMNIIAAIGKVMAGVGFVQKAGKNEFHGYKYATEGDAINGLRPHLIENGLVIVSDVLECKGPDEHGNTTVRVAYTIFHETGESLTCHFFGCGNDRNKNGVGDKGLYKALTGANKYFLLKTFQLETGDDPERDENYVRTETKPSTEQKATTIEQPKQSIDIDQLIAQIQDELEHCSSKVEARSVWTRYKSTINSAKLQVPNRDAEISAVFAKAVENLK